MLLPLLLCAVNAACPGAQSQADLATLSGAKDVLAKNWVTSMNSTLPSPHLYPHQWSWDSAFISIGYSHYDTPRAVAETNALFRAQWKNGLLPHIVFNPNADESYFPGPKFWKIETSENCPDAAQSSGIVQPPVHAIAVEAVWKNAKTDQDRRLAAEHLKEIYGKLRKWHDYLYRERDPHDEGLVFIRHMWESGMDNSPAWELALESIEVNPAELPVYKRVDKGKVGDAKERPTSFFYDRAVYLIKVFYDNKYVEKDIYENTPFAIQDVLFNSILARAEDSLANIAQILGHKEDASFHRKRSARTGNAIANKLWDEEQQFFLDYDMKTQQLIPAKISGGFVALYGAEIRKEQLESLIRHLKSDDFLGDDLSAWTIPSVSRSDAGYTNTTYWRGPAWLNINYLVREGLEANGKANKEALEISEYLKDRSIEMMNKVGFYEYFNPISGSPHGGHQFSWSAALTIDWICTQKTSVRYGNPLLLPATVVCGIILLMISAKVMARKPEEKKQTGESEEIENVDIRRTLHMSKSGLQETIKLATPRVRRNTGSQSLRRRAA